MIQKYHMRVISVKEDIRQHCLGIWFRIVKNLVVHTEIIPKQPWACQLLIPELSLRQTCTSQLQNDHVNRQRLKEINLIEIAKAYLLLEKVVPHGATFYFNYLLIIRYRHGKKDSNNKSEEKTNGCRFRHCVACTSRKASRGSKRVTSPFGHLDHWSLRKSGMIFRHVL